MTRAEINRAIGEWLARNRRSDQEQWEDFYLLPIPPAVLSDPEHYYRTRKRLIAEGKHDRWKAE